LGFTNTDGEFGRRNVRRKKRTDIIWDVTTWPLLPRWNVLIKLTSRLYCSISRTKIARNPPIYWTGHFYHQCCSWSWKS